MAYVAKGNYSYGDGVNNDIENPSGQINSYANVVNYTTNSITIGAALNGIYEKFVAGNEIMIHVSATNGTSQEITYLGKYVCAKIINVADDTLIIDTDFANTLPFGEFAKYQVQVVTIAKFRNMILSTSNLTPPAYNVTSKHGGILLVKCNNTITFSGGNINLVDRGIPLANGSYRPLTTQEAQGNADTDKYAGWENHITAEYFLLNSGDGACMIWAKKFIQLGTKSKIGGTASGIQCVRGTTGGATIAIICDEVQGFDPSIISKVKGSGKGLGRCYIATNTKLRNDEGLYAYDCISDHLRAMKELNIKGYGNGSLGDATNPTLPLNNYAQVLSVSSDGKTIAYTSKTTNGMAQISQGSTVLFHLSKHTDSADMNLLGKFILVKVLSDNGNTIIVDTPITKIIDTSKLGKYYCQIVSLAQFNNLTINANYTATTAWDNTKKIGGICAIAVKGLANIEEGKINVEAKGGGNGYNSNYLNIVGNTHSNDRLQLGQGHGSVFLLIKKAKANQNTRIGATYDGSALPPDDVKRGRGGYKGSESCRHQCYGNLLSVGLGADISTAQIFGNAATGVEKTSYQGAHVLLIVDQINYFSLKIISTGGGKAWGSKYYSLDAVLDSVDAGCGYTAGGHLHQGDHLENGGAGGYFASPKSANGDIKSGSAGCAFVYINKIEQFNGVGVVAV